MTTTKIGIGGAKGSFSEQAVKQYMLDKKIDGEIIPLITCERVLQALDDGVIDLGLFAFHNSTGGMVTEALEAMPRHRFLVQDMEQIRVQQCLMCKPGKKPEDIRMITSHDQALKQCKTYLATKWPQANLAPYEDTAKAAMDLARGILSQDTAVIAPKAAAEVYGLQMLAEAIQDLKDNFTSFFVVSKAIT